MTTLASPLWNRLDTPGHDAARLDVAGDGLRLVGTAVFLHEDGPASLTYAVETGADGVTRHGRIGGWIGPRPVDVDIRRLDAGWTLNGVPQPQVAGCRDLDLGFTPATNILHLRREALAVGETRDIPVAWFDGEGALTLLPQTYARTAEHRYDYHAPTVGYAETLEMAPSGFVTHYPGLWRAEG